MTKLVTKLGLLGIALVFSSFAAVSGANAQGGCGSGFHRSPYGDCCSNRLLVPAPLHQDCGIGYIWRNGQCRQNIGNDPFVSTWPNAPRDW